MIFLLLVVNKYNLYFAIGLKIPPPFPSISMYFVSSRELIGILIYTNTSIVSP